MPADDTLAEIADTLARALGHPSPGADGAWKLAQQVAERLRPHAATTGDVVPALRVVARHPFLTGAEMALVNTAADTIETLRRDGLHADLADASDLVRWHVGVRR